MRTNSSSAQKQASQKTQYTWAAVAALIVAMILGAFAGIPTVGADSDGIQKGIDASSARWAALGSSFAQGSEYTDVDKFYAERMRSFMAQASDETDVAKFYSERMRSFMAQAPEYTDVDKFYAERMRNEAGQSAALASSQEFFAANPELMFAQRSYRAADDMLAANPELMSARQAYSQGMATCTTDEDRLAANPELMFLQQRATC